MKWLKKIFRKKWPKRILIEVRDGDCKLIDFTIVKIYSWDQVMSLGAHFSQEVMSHYSDENLDEVYWNYEEVN